MKKEKIVICAAIIASVIFILVFFTISSPVAASENVKKEKVIISVCVKEGDTLWSIASKYYTNDYKDIHEFIYAIKSCNGISDQIKIGQRILIPYYRTVL